MWLQYGHMSMTFLYRHPQKFVVTIPFPTPKPEEHTEEFPMCLNYINWKDERLTSRALPRQFFLLLFYLHFLSSCTYFKNLSSLRVYC